MRAGGHPFTLERRRDGTLFLQVNSPTFTDFEFLRGMPIGELDISRTAVADLSPAVSLPLKKLTAGHTRLSDLAPLRGLPLESIDLAGTVVTNIEPLLQCPSLRIVELPRSALGVGALRGLPNLTQIGYEAAVPAAEFWRKFDADKR